MNVYYYKQVNYGRGYELIGQDTLQAAREDGRMMGGGDIHYGGGHG